MNKEELINRNNDIINVVMERINKTCKDSIDLIGIVGSFENNDFYDKSDLDLIVIINSDDGKKIDTSFIMGDIGFDIYTQKWKDIENISNYDTPYISKIFNLNRVYVRNSLVISKMESIREKAIANMNNDFHISNKIKEYYNQLKIDLNKIENNDNLFFGYSSLYDFVTKFEYIIFMKNREYIHCGTKRIPEELLKLRDLPENCESIYKALYNSSNIEEIRINTKNAFDILGRWLKITAEDMNYIIGNNVIKQDINNNNIKGTYEEFFSNYANKLKQAVITKDIYLSFSAMGAAQAFLDEMYDNFNVERINLIDKYSPNDLANNLKAYLDALTKWRENYDKVGIKINYYKDIEDLKNRLYR